MMNESDNKQNQPTSWQYNSTSYVYPDHDASTGQTPAGPGKPQKDPRRSTRVIGIVAIVLSVVVVFSALTGTAVYLLMKDRPEPTGQTQQTTQPSETTAVTTTAETTSETSSTTTGSDLHNPYFSLADAASRHVDGKETLTIMEIAAQGKPAVVAITTEMTVTDMFGQVYRPTASGSGFIITDDGYIVTNNHVIEGAETITVVLDNDDAYPAILVGTDPSNDVAVIKIEETGLPTVFLGNSDDLLVGELAVAIGNPLGELSGTVTAGIISALDREITLSSSSGTQKMNLLQTDAAINSGNSGGALFNSFGEVIGINTAKNTGTGVEGLGFAIPIDHAEPIIESLIQYGYVRGRPKIGITARNISAQMAEYYKLTEGIYIVEIENGSAAAEAGLRAKDIIITANGEETLTIEALNAVKNKLKPGDTITLTVVRDGREMTIVLTLKEELPAEYTPTSNRSGTGFSQL
ncbi:MAG: trypsin-like peptidase domain-containing protein [Bacillota bacterium]|nr:trypsin-like peptidase domain-containing protein [Bacillota bacterium]